jgi:hypothetical protein
MENKIDYKELDEVVLPIHGTVPDIPKILEKNPTFPWLCACMLFWI